MGYYTAGIYHVSNTNEGMIIQEPAIIDPARNLYVSYTIYPQETGVIIGKLFDSNNNLETFNFVLPEAISVMDRYESIKNVKIIENKINVQYFKNGKEYEYEFYPKLLKNRSNNTP